MTFIIKFLVINLIYVFIFSSCSFFKLFQWYFYINTLKKRISEIKQNRIDKEQFEKNLKEKSVDELIANIDKKIKTSKSEKQDKKESKPAAK